MSPGCAARVSPNDRPRADTCRPSARHAVGPRPRPLPREMRYAAGTGVATGGTCAAVVTERHPRPAAARMPTHRRTRRAAVCGGTARARRTRSPPPRRAPPHPDRAPRRAAGQRVTRSQTCDRRTQTAPTSDSDDRPAGDRTPVADISTRMTAVDRLDTTPSRIPRNVMHVSNAAGCHARGRHGRQRPSPGIST